MAAPEGSRVKLRGRAGPQNSRASGRGAGVLPRLVEAGPLTFVLPGLANPGTSFPVLQQREPFKKRWFALDPQERRLLYYKNPLDPFELGQVFLGSNEQGYEVCADLPKGIRGNRWKAGLTVVTPERRFVFTCPSEKEQQEWLESFRDVLSRPLTPLNLLTQHKNSDVHRNFDHGPLQGSSPLPIASQPTPPTGPFVPSQSDSWVHFKLLLPGAKH